MYILFTLIPQLASAFSGNSRIRKMLLVLQFWYFALSRKFIFGHKEMRFYFCYRRVFFTLYIESIVDLAALKEVFLLEEYAWMPVENPKIIIDLGAHFGDTALYYHLRFPNATIYAVEPATKTFERLKRNVGSIAHIIPIQAGIADHDGFAQLHIGKSSLGSSFTHRTDVIRSEQVPVCTLSTLLKKCNTISADLIKFDIEGAEEHLFVSGKPEDFGAAYIGEVHEDLLTVSSQAFIEVFSQFEVSKDILSNTKRFILKAKKTTV